ncbi:MAG: lipopolysaccharide heptosyltransferase II [Bacteroidetes bacterium]|nr:lipopolysaccharide heptosyltransferase II [Bacteroidota bacterium]
MTLPSRTVVLRLSSIGDIVLTSPLLRVFRQAVGKDARVDFVVRKEYADLVRSCHHLSIVHEYDVASGYSGLKELARQLREERYELVIDLHDSIRTKLLRAACKADDVVVMDKRKLERWLLVNLKRNAYSDALTVAERYIETVEKYGIVNDNKGLEIFIPDTTLFEVSGRMAKLRLNQFEKVIGLCPGSKHFTKRWPKERFAEVAVQAAQEFHAKVLLFGGKDEMEDCRFVEEEVARRVGPASVAMFAGEYSLLESTATLEFCDVVVTNDSGLMHLAAAKQRRIVAIFGSTVREFGFAPYGTEAVVLENESLDCRPCTHIGRKDCPKGHLKCLTEIPAEQVMTALRKLL